MRKRRLALAVAAALACMALMLCGCSGSNDYQPKLKEATLSSPTIGEDGTLRVGVNTENPPLAGMGSGKIIGIDVDIASAIADELGLKVSIVDVGGDPAAALSEGKVDLVLGIDPSSVEGDFWTSPSYLPTGIALFAMSPDAGIPTADSGALFAAQVSSKSAWAVSNEFGEDSLTSTDSLSDAFAALEAGTVQYVAADAIIGLYAAHGQKLDVSAVAMLMKPGGYCMAVASENTDLQTAAGDALTKLVEGGVVDVIERKWLGAGVALDGLTVIGDGSELDADAAAGESGEGTGDEAAGEGAADEAAGDGSGEGESTDGSGEGDTGDASGDAGDGSGDASSEGDTGDASADGDASGDEEAQ